MCDIPYSVYPSKKIIESGGGGIPQTSELNSVFTAQDIGGGEKALRETELFFSKSGDTSSLYIYDDVNNNIPLQFTATQDNVDNNNNTVSISVDNVSSSALTLLGSKVGVNKAVPSYQLEVGGDVRGDDIHGDLLALQNNFTEGGTIFLQTDVVQLTSEMAGAGLNGGELVIKTKTDGGSITEKVRITEGGNLGVGTTTPGEKLEVNGNVKGTNIVAGDGSAIAPSINFGHNTGFYNIPHPSGHIYDQVGFSQNGVGRWFYGSNFLTPVTTNTIALGVSARRWSQVWSQNPLNSSSDVNLKKDISDTTLGLDFVKLLRPVEYRWKETDGRQGVRKHQGLIAQELKIALDTADNSSDQAMWCEEEGMQSVRYAELIPALIKAIQEQQAQIETLMSKL